MAGGGLLALLDDIAAILDDIAVMTKVAAKKTAGVLGDDLALNAQQVSGIRAERELPVVWAVAKGSVKNKLIIVPSALLITAFIPWAMTPLLMLGGLFLCFEGVEKLLHKSSEKDHEELADSLVDQNTDLVAYEQEKIKGAIRTDFILSAEIVVIALGTVQDADFTSQLGVVIAIAAIMTIGVYGLVAAIVKLDDAALYLIDSSSETLWGRCKKALGRKVLWFCPYLLKILTIVGTAAMFLVGGGIITHGIEWLHHLIGPISQWVSSLPGIGSYLNIIMPLLINGVVGICAGLIIFFIISGLGYLRKKTA